MQQTIHWYSVPMIVRNEEEWDEDKIFSTMKLMVEAHSALRTNGFYSVSSTVLQEIEWKNH